jgi:hypothetical protein
MRPTDAEIVALLYRASWQVQGVGYQLSADERTAMAKQMREMGLVLVPARVDAMDGAAEFYRPGTYNGD